MIANNIMYISLMIVLSVLYFELRYLRPKKGKHIKSRLLLWLPALGMLAFTIFMACQEHFAPRDTTVFYTYLILEGYYVVPLFAYVVCSAAGFAVKKLFKFRRHYGNIIGLLGVIAIWVILSIGITSGFTGLKVRHVTFESKDIPPSFNGYRIVQFSDLHIGSYGPSRQYLVSNLIDSINAQHADVIVFTGDLQNIHPEELYPHLNTLSLLKAPDGVISVLGNHDYADYLDFDDINKEAINREIVRIERGMGWTVLCNEHTAIRRDNDSIVFAGTENIYLGHNERCISRGDVSKAMSAVDSTAFTVMLQHSPISWRKYILPQSHAQLTLSGDTHGMQFSIFGWCPMSLINSEWGGFFRECDRAINVSTGVGGLVPFRFGMTPEIVVITLKTKTGN